MWHDAFPMVVSVGALVMVVLHRARMRSLIATDQEVQRLEARLARKDDGCEVASDVAGLTARALGNGGYAIQNGVVAVCDVPSKRCCTSELSQETAACRSFNL